MKLTSMRHVVARDLTGIERERGNRQVWAGWWVGTVLDVHNTGYWIYGRLRRWVG